MHMNEWGPINVKSAGKVAPRLNEGRMSRQLYVGDISAAAVLGRHLPERVDPKRGAWSREAWPLCGREGDMLNFVALPLGQLMPKNVAQERISGAIHQNDWAPIEVTYAGELAPRKYEKRTLGQLCYYVCE